MGRVVLMGEFWGRIKIYEGVLHFRSKAYSKSGDPFPFATIVHVSKSWFGEKVCPVATLLYELASYTLGIGIFAESRGTGRQMHYSYLLCYPSLVSRRFVTPAQVLLVVFSLCKSPSAAYELIVGDGNNVCDGGSPRKSDS